MAQANMAFPDDGIVPSHKQTGMERYVTLHRRRTSKRRAMQRQPRGGAGAIGGLVHAYPEGGHLGSAPSSSRLPCPASLFFSLFASFKEMAQDCDPQPGEQSLECSQTWLCASPQQPTSPKLKQQSKTRTKEPDPLGLPHCPSCREQKRLGHQGPRCHSAGF